MKRTERMTRAKRISQLRDRARARRQNPPRQHARLWRRVRANRLGVRFRRNEIVYPFLVDFQCRKAKLVVEIEGAWEWERRDPRCYEMMERQHGVTILKFSVHEVERDLDGVVRRIGEVLDALGA